MQELLGPITSVRPWEFLRNGFPSDDILFFWPLASAAQDRLRCAVC